MEFTQITEVNVTSFKNYIFNKLGWDAIHDIIISEFEKYPSTTILKYVTILAEVINLHNIHFLKMTPNKKRPV